MIKALMKKAWYAFFDEHPHTQYLHARRAFKRVWHRFFEDHPYTYPGRVLIKVLPSRYVDDAYENFYDTEGASRWTPRWTGKFIRAEIRRQYFSEEDGAKRRAVRARLWGGDAGKKWHSHRDKEYSFAAFDNDVYRAEVLRQIIACQTSYPEHWMVVEVGVGSGIFLDYLAHKLEQGTAFMGIDLNRNQIIENRNNYADSHLEFVHSDITEWLEDYREDNAILMVTCGTLMYLTQRELENVLRMAKRRRGRSAFAIRESVDLDFAPSMKQSYPDGSDIDIGFVHNYSHLFERNGFKILEEESIPFYDRKRVIITAVSS